VRVIAPSSPFDVAEFEAGVARLATRYRVSFDPSIFARRGFLAGDDARRRAELEAAIEDPSVDAIVAVRGGYGAMRIVAGIDPARLSARPRVLVGLSDVTALHALWARAGVSSIHGAMVTALGRAPEALVERWFAALEGAPPAPVGGLVHLAGPRVTAEGPLLGGNLTLLAAMVGTPLAMPLAGAILFLEEIGEAPYRIDRMLTQLRLSGALDEIAGVVLGTFTRCDPRADGTTALETVRERLDELGVPVLAGIPAGHDEEGIELPFGAPVAIDARRGVVTFLRGAVSPG
jgi:muramoyltetrapeptide carboxypeptidase